MRHRRDRPLRVDCKIFRLVLIKIQHVDVVAGEGDTLFHQRKHGLAGIRIRLPMIKRHICHVDTPLKLIRPFPTGMAREVRSGVRP